MSATPPRECITTNPAPLSALTRATVASSRPPDTSFTMCAPADTAASATVPFTVSTETTASGRSASTPRITGSTRRISSTALTGSAPCGRVDSPPMSTRSAPSSSRVSACAMAKSASAWRPPSLKLSGVTFTMPITSGCSSDSARSRTCQAADMREDNQRERGRRPAAPPFIDATIALRPAMAPARPAAAACVAARSPVPASPRGRAAASAAPR